MATTPATFIRGRVTLSGLKSADLWLRSVRAAYKLAHRQRLAQLRGKRVKSFDDRGLHPYSEMWGRIILAESDSAVGKAIACGYFPPLSPESLRRMAEDDAYRDFITELTPNEGETDGQDH